MSLERPTQDEIGQWLTDRVSEWFLSEIRELLDDALHNLADGGTLSDNPNQSIQLTAKAVGKVDAINRILERLEDDTEW